MQKGLVRMASNGNNRRIAYFSMEIALESDIPTYSGGLGILAGDTLRSAADMEVPMVAVTLVYNNGYFYQMLDHDGNQRECDIMWDYSAEFKKLPGIIRLGIHEHTIDIGAWLYNVVGHTGYTIPVYLLDTNVESNDEWKRNFTRILYDATPYQRLMQEIILGIGGMKLLEAMRHDGITTYHMNEGHSAFLTLELLERLGGNADEVRKRCVFTTHTPVGAGHDRFPYDMVGEALRGNIPENIGDLAGSGDLNMTRLAVSLSRYVNGVSKKHGEISAGMFPDREVDSITNGVHSLTWVHPELQHLYRQMWPNFEHDPGVLKGAERIENDDLWRIHNNIKGQLLGYEKSHSWVLMDRNLLTMGFARRVTGYKRPLLILSDLDWLGNICKDKAQIIMAGKTHPNDGGGKDLIKKIFEASKYLWDHYGVKLVFLNNYDMDMAKLLVSGVDLWLNTPTRYLEASGTSGMKAAHNGVPNFSVLDGWWIEGWRRSGGMAGWTIGPAPDDPDRDEITPRMEAEEFYTKLEDEIIPMYFRDRRSWMIRMKQAIKLAAHFNTHRMVREYAARSWRLKPHSRWIQVPEPEED